MRFAKKFSASLPKAHFLLGLYVLSKGWWTDIELALSLAAGVKEDVEITQQSGCLVEKFYRELAHLQATVERL